MPDQPADHRLPHRRSDSRRLVRLSILFGLLSAVLIGTGVALAAGTFVDDDGNTHEGNIEAIAAEGITKGCNPPANDRYCPDDPVTRGQMAAFLRRAFNLSSAGQDHFTDDNGNTFEADINALAEAGITKGCNPPDNDEYCPNGHVTRGQMAAFLRRAFDYPSASEDFFGDDNGSTFEADINAIAAQGVTKGCNPPTNDRYCPDELVLRDQMASFLARALGLSPVDVTPGRVWTLLGAGSPTFDDDFDDNSFQVEGVASNGEVAVAVGTAPTAISFDDLQDVPVGLAWYSTDGRDWSRASFFEGVTETLMDTFTGSIHTVVEWREGFVAAGCTGSAVGETYSRVWFSDDGEVWELLWAQDGQGPPVPSTCINDLVSYTFPETESPVLMAVGWRATEVGSEQRAGAAWSASVDGTTFFEREISRPDWVAPDADIEATSVGSKTEDFLGLVAVGHAFNAGEPSEGIVWTSVDGGFWPTPPPRVDASALWYATGSTTDLVVTGARNGSDRDGGIWTSPAGSEWSQIASQDVFGGSGDQAVRGLTFHGSNWIAVGDDFSNPAAWFSTNGNEWASATGVGDAFSADGTILDVTVHQGNLIAVGETDDVGAVWISPP